MARRSGGGSSRGTATDSSTQVDVIGLRDFQRELRKMGPAFPKKLRQQNYKIAKKVENRSKRKAQSLGGTKAKAAVSIRAVAEQRNASIRLDGRKHPYALGAEFGTKRMTKGERLPGGQRGPRKFYGGFGPWRGNQWQAWGNSGVGYFLHPTIRDMREEIMDDYSDMVKRLAAEAFPH